MLISSIKAVLQLQQELLHHTPMLRHLTVGQIGLLRTLATVPPSNHLRSFSVRVNTIFPDLEWAALDAALAEPRFCALQRFALRRTGLIRLSPAQKALMPLADARGIL